MGEFLETFSVEKCNPSTESLELGLRGAIEQLDVSNQQEPLRAKVSGQGSNQSQSFDQSLEIKAENLEVEEIEVVTVNADTSE